MHDPPALQAGCRARRAEPDLPAAVSGEGEVQTCCQRQARFICPAVLSTVARHTTVLSCGMETAMRSRNLAPLAPPGTLSELSSTILAPICRKASLSRAMRPGES